MKLENLKDQFPKTPQNIQEMIQREVQMQMKPNKKKNTLVWKKSVAAALVATLALGSTVFAAVQAYQWYVEKQGTYSLKTSFSSEQGAQPPKQVPQLNFQLNYLPQGMVKNPHEDSKYSNEEHLYQGGVSVWTMAMDKTFSPTSIPLTDKYITNYEQLTIQDHEAVYADVDTTGQSGIPFDKRIYIAYPEYWQVVEIYIGSDVSKEEAMKIAENLVVQTGEQMLEFSSLQKWSEKESPQQDIEWPDSTPTVSKETMLQTLHTVGESFSIPSVTFDGEEINVSAKVANVQVMDDFSLLKEDGIDQSMKEQIGADGKLIQNKIDYIKPGDGIDSLNEVVYSENIDQKLVYLTVEMTNNEQKEVQNVHFLGDFASIVETAEGFAVYNRALMDNNAETMYVSPTGARTGGEMDYFDVPERGGNGKNYISSIAPGETVTIHIARIVNADELDKLYFSMEPSGSGLMLGESALSIGYVDIRQK